MWRGVVWRVVVWRVVVWCGVACCGVVWCDVFKNNHSHTQTNPLKHTNPPTHLDLVRDANEAGEVEGGRGTRGDGDGVVPNDDVIRCHGTPLHAGDA